MYSPSTETNQYLLKCRKKCRQYQNLKQKKSDIDQIWQSQAKGSAVSLKLTKM